ncbi:TetR family transcriptional regulator [Tamaricihabitans halophyticus]|uniref:TetR family transcriptional regulator n=2 Tax=Tamaricihabitans halophyticus TaxID=1262583 RepID=A0A4R2QA54_9PSEU|nr:TetR family transcriptional regulator [Tamaricihabitans halophyticus]
MEAAYTLFQHSGFDRVSVAEIAAAAEVSKPTLFAYFPTKEDLVLRRFIDERKSPAWVLRERQSDVPTLTALRQFHLDRLADRDPLTGLNDTPAAITFHRLCNSTPALLARLTVDMLDLEHELAGELLTSGGLTDGFSARLVASQVFSAQWVLSDYNANEIRFGRSADETYPGAVRRTEEAFDALQSGLAAMWPTLD